VQTSKLYGLQGTLLINNCVMTSKHTHNDENA